MLPVLTDGLFQAVQYVFARGIVQLQVAAAGQFDETVLDGIGNFPAREASDAAVQGVEPEAMSTSVKSGRTLLVNKLFIT